MLRAWAGSTGARLEVIYDCCDVTCSLWLLWCLEETVWCLLLSGDEHMTPASFFLSFFFLSSFLPSFLSFTHLLFHSFHLFILSFFSFLLFTHSFMAGHTRQKSASKGKPPAYSIRAPGSPGASGPLEAAGPGAEEES